MKRIDHFSSEEQACINLGKERLTEIAPLKRHLERLAAAERKIVSKMTALGCRRAKLSPLNGNGCKPRGTSTQPSMKMCRLMDELGAIKEEITETEVKVNKIMNTIFKMPTERYKEILLKKYVTSDKVSARERDLRYYYLYPAYLEFYNIYYWNKKNIKNF